MSTAYTKTGGEPFNTQDSLIFTWTLAAGEAGDPVVMPAFADRSVQYFGVFGATLVWEGTNEPTTPAPSNYETLTDALGNPISAVAHGLKAVTEMVRLARPRVIGGDGSTAITVILMVKR